MTTKRGDKSGVKGQELFKYRIRSRISARKTEKGNNGNGTEVLAKI